MNIWNQNMPFYNSRFWVKHHSLFYRNAVCKPAPHQQHRRYVTVCNLCLFCCWSWIFLELQSRSQSLLQCILSHELVICFSFLASWHNFIQWDNEADSAFPQQIFFFLALCSRVLLPLWFSLRGDGSHGHDLPFLCWHWLCEDCCQKSVTVLITHSCMAVCPLKRQRIVRVQVPY